MIADRPEEWRQHVTNSISKWKIEAQKLKPHLEGFRSRLSEEQQGTVRKLDPIVLTEMIKTAQHVDQQYVNDLLAGFPITGELHSHGTGKHIPGGQRTHGRPAHGIIPDTQKLKCQCAQINAKTIKRARARIPEKPEDVRLAEATWEKILADTQKGRVGEPVGLDSIPLDEVLLVDTFGIWERHGSASQDTLRVINNFKANLANDYAYMSEKLAYDGFGQLKESCARFRSKCPNKLKMGKADFKSAFKTLPPAENQKWLCFSLVYNPVEKKLQVIQLFTQAFGSLGGVVAWYRTAKMIQCIMQELFGIVVFAYVDDFFWVVPDGPAACDNTANFVLDAFKQVVNGILGWELDAEKEEVGDDMLLLGIQITLDEQVSKWRFNPSKAKEWANDFQKAMDEDSLPPALASKFCGRVAFLNSTVFNRLGRALVRPLIWRQLQRIGQVSLTRRLRHSLRWLIAVLRSNLCREIPYVQQLVERKVILYSDADGNAGVGAVAIRGGTKIFMRGKIPAHVRRKLRKRKTNIIAYELLIAVAAMVSFCPEILNNVSIDHYIDSQPALSCILKASSPQSDLSDISGRLWFECCHSMVNYYAKYVPSKCNLADGPSRDDVATLLKLGFVEVPFRFPAFQGHLASWLEHPDQVCRLAI